MRSSGSVPIVSVMLSSAALRRFTEDLLAAAGVDRAEAALVAESLVDANLRGHESHGVVRLPDYVEQLKAGELRAGAPLIPLAETAAVLAGDAGFGFGQVQCRRLIDRLEPKARMLGIACGTLKNCGHVGRLGEWTERIAARGLAGLITVNDNGVLKCVAPPGGIGPRISTNPVAIGVPAGGEPLSLDISTSAVANGKIRVAQLAGREVPAGWLLDAAGNPTTDPSTRFADPPGTIVPMGGEQGYKGFGLGLLLDILAGGLSGGFCPPAPAGTESTNNVLLVMWDPERFAGAAHFQAEADKLIDAVRTTPRKPGVDAIRLPGDRGRSLHEERSEHGAPLDAGTWRSLSELASTLKVTAPQPIP